jgi:hypothetical protein
MKCFFIYVFLDIVVVVDSGMGIWDEVGLAFGLVARLVISVLVGLMILGQWARCWAFVGSVVGLVLLLRLVVGPAMGLVRG